MHKRKSNYVHKIKKVDQKNKADKSFIKKNIKIIMIKKNKKNMIYMEINIMNKQAIISYKIKI